MSHACLSLLLQGTHRLFWFFFGSVVPLSNPVGAQCDRFEDAEAEHRDGQWPLKTENLGLFTEPRKKTCPSLFRKEKNGGTAWTVLIYRVKPHKRFRREPGGCGVTVVELKAPLLRRRGGLSNDKSLVAKAGLPLRTRFVQPQLRTCGELSRAREGQEKAEIFTSNDQRSTGRFKVLGVGNVGERSRGSKKGREREAIKMGMRPHGTVYSSTAKPETVGMAVGGRGGCTNTA